MPSEIDLSKLSWRQLGFQLDEAKRGSNPDLYVYHKLLDEARKRAGDELIDLEALIRMRTPPEPLPDQPPLEKVADFTHKGPSL